MKAEDGHDDPEPRQLDRCPRALGRSDPTYHCPGDCALPGGHQSASVRSTRASPRSSSSGPLFWNPRANSSPASCFTLSLATSCWNRAAFHKRNGLRRVPIWLRDAHHPCHKGSACGQYSRSIERSVFVERCLDQIRFWWVRVRTLTCSASSKSPAIGRWWALSSRTISASTCASAGSDFAPEEPSRSRYRAAWTGLTGYTTSRRGQRLYPGAAVGLDPD
jgi:hypothetical protein